MRKRRISFGPGKAEAPALPSNTYEVFAALFLASYLGGLVDLVFEGTDEERRAQAEVHLIRICRDLYGNGEPGLVREVGRFITRQNTIEEQQDKRHKENRWRLNAIIALLAALLGAAVGLLPVLLRK
jgi:hypothetical protein